MSSPVWQPSLEDTAQNDLSARLRAGLRAALPEFVRQQQPDGDPGAAARSVEISEPALGLTLSLKATHTRSVVRKSRPVLEIRFRGIMRFTDPKTRRREDVPVTGECRLDINSGAIVHLAL